MIQRLLAALLLVRAAAMQQHQQQPRQVRSSSSSSGRQHRQLPLSCLTGLVAVQPVLLTMQVPAAVQHQLQMVLCCHPGSS
jgi:hypothetical protein